MTGENKKPRIIRLRKGNEVECVKLAAQSLRNGRLVIMPTDTVYGVAADPHAEGAQELLFKAKGRDRNKPVSLLAAGIDQIEECGAVLGDLERRLAMRFWPGPLTIVLNVGAGTEGFRIPACRFALSLLREVGILRVTSANLSGEPAACSVEEAIRALEGHVDLVIDAGPSADGTPSTVVKVEHGVIKPLRAGAISVEELEKACRIV